MSRLTEHRRLIPGSTGWSVHDLDDPRIEAEWEAGHFQIIEGVLAIMPPAYFETNDQIGRGKTSVTPKCFAGVSIDLAKVWDD